ncbi:MAG: hypothetical protein FWF59_11785 [Turicibacter sp.]|nr:hypothetical protein [Turicibacter sp.]
MDECLINEKDLKMQGSLLHVINQVAKKLLVGERASVGPEQLQEGMGAIGGFLGVERVKMWRIQSHEGVPHFVLAFEWLSGSCIGEQPLVGLKFPLTHNPISLKNSTAMNMCALPYPK